MKIKLPKLKLKDKNCVMLLIYRHSGKIRNDITPN